MDIYIKELNVPLPDRLVCPLVYFIERRIPYKRYSQGELKRRVLRQAVQIVQFYNMKTTPAFKEAVRLLVESLVDLYRYKAIDDVACDVPIEGFSASYPTHSEISQNRPPPDVPSL
jgi:hypothetical protein